MATAVSAAFGHAIRNGGLIEARAELWQAGAQTADVELVGGTITIDRTAGTRRTCSVSIAGLEGLLPVDGEIGTDTEYGDGTYGEGIYGDYRRRALRGLLMAGASELRLFWSITTSAGPEEISLGHYRVAQPAFHDAPEGVIVSVTGYDISRSISRARWTEPFTIAQGTNTATAISAVVSSRSPGTSTSIDTTAHTTPRLILGIDGDASDPWQDVRDLAASIGHEAYVDAEGQVVTVPVPDLATAVMGEQAWDLVDGDDGTAMDLEASSDDEDLINSVTARSSNSDNGTQVSATVTDEDPSSPYRPDLVGLRPIFYESSYISTEAQAVDAAGAMLRSRSGLVEKVEITCLPLPHMDGGEIIRVASEELQIDDLYLLDRIQFDLIPGQPTQVTCSRRVV